ncbi:succinate-semialdehyde dehydrogenase [Solemya pervernicosa gill symbiont]|uniref:Succinate-semialdehyde dehydrogenase n=1 Tax=Solemya pervernicosa gill symbiont TaxID=642797 RepID=A0A1T2L024_9GAMM|nr:NAD-dependent succinate-semialdehyde dehydrogenase [Solemya pervernicosa gill symbiont]OOZ38422.1 succinate-semialdehyde dehydrogenase [Solemya pervernicosa gill symbiont]
MPFKSINPADDATLTVIQAFDADQLEAALAETAAVTLVWSATPIQERCRLMHAAATVLRSRSEELATLISQEMGKLIGEARAEVEKCALVCEYYEEFGPGFLRDESIDSDATNSFVAYQPIGTVLAVMPWNFPFWQVFRFAAPALIAGNTGLLKHASNVPQCALAIESVFHDAGFPAGVFRSLMIPASEVEGVIRDPRVAAVTLTGSEPAGRKVAAVAGEELKKSVLELGGSDAFVVLEDADLDLAVAGAVASRFLNAGQSCIAAKRFIVVDVVADQFVTQFKEAVEALEAGDPLDEKTTLGPMARADLRSELHKQVSDSLASGAEAITGCRPLVRPGSFYAASILDRVEPGMRAYSEEFFGPVAIVIRARDEADAMRIANDSRFGLGGSIWTEDSERGEALARQVESGCTFVNGMVKSDPRLPFGGVKASGYGRELSHQGIREFVNAKTIWIR